MVFEVFVSKTYNSNPEMNKRFPKIIQNNHNRVFKRWVFLDTFLLFPKNFYDNFKGPLTKSFNF